MANSELKCLVISSKESDSERRAFVSEMLKDVQDENITFVTTNYRSLSEEEICGGDKFYARSMYEKATYFEPIHPITCMAGYTPESSESDAVWRRIRAARTNDKWNNLLKSDHQIQGRMFEKM